MAVSLRPFPPQPPPRPRRWGRLHSKRFGYWVLALWLATVLLYSPLNLALARWLWPQPDAILVLGGHRQRELQAARFAYAHAELPVWVSSGLGPDQALPLFGALGVADRITLDYRAVDTVSNFTSLVRDFRRRQVHHLYLVTSDYHMGRARAIATVVLGRYRIAFTPVRVATQHPPETALHIARDLLRAWVWVFTGWSGGTPVKK